MVNFVFGDGFDLYAQPSDAALGYWDSASVLTSGSLSNGRFAGSHGYTFAGGVAFQKTSGSNDNIHHFVLAFQQTSTLSGSAIGVYVELFDGASGQCSVAFRQDGAIVLTNGGPGGTILATYTGALTATNVWFAFEIEVVIHNTTGSIAIRKNGNNTNDFSATGLNTRNGSANAYANMLKLGGNAGTPSTSQVIDDFLWRSDTSSVPWVGDIRCWTRLPASDASAQWSRSASVVTQTPFGPVSTQLTATAGNARYSPFVATCSGTIGSLVLSMNAGFTGNMKCTLFNDNSGVPGTVVGSASVLNNPVAGNNTITFASPPSLTRGATYWVGFDTDTTISNGYNVGSSIGLSGVGASSSVAYASFPVANPTSVSGGSFPNIFTLTITPTTVSNAMLVSEAIQDGANTYLSDSTIGDADFYVPGAIAVTPAATVAVVTRGLFEKTDAGTRNVAVQVHSGATTSPGTSTALNTVWGWIYRVDQTDPDTGAAWTASGVNNMTFGPKVTA